MTVASISIANTRRTASLPYGLEAGANHFAGIQARTGLYAAPLRPDVAGSATLTGYVACAAVPARRRRWIRRRDCPVPGWPVDERTRREPLPVRDLPHQRQRIVPARGGGGDDGGARLCQFRRGGARGRRRLPRRLHDLFHVRAGDARAAAGSAVADGKRVRDRQLRRRPLRGARRDRGRESVVDLERTSQAADGEMSRPRATAARRLAPRAVADKPEKPRAARRPSAARRSGLSRHPRTGGAELRATPPTSQTRETAAKSRSAWFFVRSKRLASTARCARHLAAVWCDQCPLESTGQVAAAGRQTRHARARDGNRVRKRSGH